jgi:hypothetical protein
VLAGGAALIAIKTPADAAVNGLWLDASGVTRLADLLAAAPTSSPAPRSIRTAAIFDPVGSGAAHPVSESSQLC